jgi:cell division protein FtsW
MKVTLPTLSVADLRESAARHRESLPPADRLVWLASMGLMALGTVMVLSSSIMLAARKFGTPGHFWTRQLLWWGLATVIMYVISRINYRKLKPYVPLFMIAAVAALIVVLFVPAIKGVHRWIPLGPFNLQPSEGFRLAFIVYAAAYLAKRVDKMQSFKQWLPLVIILAVCTILIMAQPEFSTVLTLWAITGIMLVGAGARWRHLLPGVIGVVVAVSLLVFVFGYKTQRVNDWKSGLTVTGGSYQVRQSKIAIGSGGLLGEGLGDGRAKMLYLPEPHTDFIIASIGEELGFVGFSAVLAALGLLIARSWRIGAQAPDRFGYMLCLGIGASLFVNAFLNLAVATGLAPATGLPLPFVSYGGSSLLTTAAGWGLVLNVSRSRSAGGWK